jgi:hypothetical protein
VVNEHLYTGPGGPGLFCLGTAFDPALGAHRPRFRPIEVSLSSFVLADKLGYCRFAYREVLPPPARERWVPLWIKPEWPSAIRIEMAAKEPDPTRLQPLTLTVPLRVTKNPRQPYAD